MTRSCLTCQTRLRGRSDQRFCSDHCRNHYHNHRKQKERSFFRKVNQILYRNRKILHQLADRHRLRVPCEELSSSGFNFDYCTSWQKNADQEIIFICYDMAYHRTGEEILIYRYGRTIPSARES